MPSFKPKASKKIKINKKSIVTLDSKHDEKMEEFLDISNNIIPKLKKEKLLLKKEKGQVTNIDEKLAINDRIIEIKKEIKKLKKQKNEYLLKNSSYIFEYFEKKKKYIIG